MLIVCTKCEHLFKMRVVETVPVCEYVDLCWIKCFSVIYERLMVRGEAEM